jgi:hypothetical protein
VGSSRPFRVLFLFAILWLVWAAILPGVVARARGVYFDSQVEAIAVRNFSEVADDLAAHRTFERTAQNLVRNASAALESELATKDGTKHFDSLYTIVARPPKAPTRNFQVAGFQDNQTTPIFFVHFVAMSALLLWGGHRLRFGTGLKLGGILFVIYEWPNWVRNFWLNTPSYGRKVFSYVHWDIDKVSFLLQEARVLTMTVLVALLWEQRARTVSDYELMARNDTSLPYEVIARSESLTNAFAAWQVDSILLALAFLPWTYFYWLEVNGGGGVGDRRYLVSAVFAHVLWASTWALLSGPLWKGLREWNRAKLALLQSVVETVPGNALSLIQEGNPLNTASVIGAGLAAVISFLLPLASWLK